jgi:hypothetical protein
MAKWALVENNEVKELHDLLPKSWRNVSGLRLSENNLEYLKSLGWLPVEYVEEPYDTEKYFVESYNYNIQSNRVVGTNKLSEKEDYNNRPYFEKEAFLSLLRTERDKRLKESDWTQLQDVQEIFTEEEKNDWKNYRQQLRDLPEIYINNDIDIASIYEVNWPTLPVS